MKPLLEVRNLGVSFFTRDSEVKAVRDISFELREGEVLGVVGESGSGKSVTAHSIMRLLKQNGQITRGDILFKGENLVEKSEREMMSIRGNEIAMIFQDPMTSLNPVFTIGKQISDIIRRHRGLSRAAAKVETIRTLEMVGIPDPSKRYDSYPHEFSGGMRQRVLISMALSCAPDLLIADEPTTALDVTIQAQILQLLLELKEKLDTSIMLITHDLGVVANTCGRVLVMYGGLIMEEGTITDIFQRPMHPYTKGLLRSLPNSIREKKRRLVPIPGSPPDPRRDPSGCPFADRCAQVRTICYNQKPPYYKRKMDHRAMCWLLHGQAARGGSDGRP